MLATENRQTFTSSGQSFSLGKYKRDELARERTDKQAKKARVSPELEEGEIVEKKPQKERNRHSISHSHSNSKSESRHDSRHETKSRHESRHDSHYDRYESRHTRHKSTSSSSSKSRHSQSHSHRSSSNQKEIVTKRSNEETKLPTKDTYQKEVEEQLEALVSDDEEKRIEAARARRKALLQELSGEQKKPEIQFAISVDNTNDKGIIPPSIVKKNEDEFSPSEQSNTETPQRPETPEDTFDMFGDASIPSVSASAQEGCQHVSNEIIADEEGYSCITIGEILGGRYQVFGRAGKGVFSVVFKARDVNDPKREVAVKITRENEYMKRVGRKEIDRLLQIRQMDPDDRKCCVQFIEAFEEKGFQCLVFEPMWGGSLRKVLDQQGKGVGLNLRAVQFYTKRILVALSHVKKCSLLHTDVKLDNILVDESKTRLKLADFGSAVAINEIQTTPRYCPMWYRAPEIILGVGPYSYGIDIWSVACSLYELATGNILFPGKTENEMLKLYMDVKGKFPKKMLSKGLYVKEYFDDQFNFLQIVPDPVTGKELVKVVSTIKATKCLKTELLNSYPNSTEQEKKKLLELHDLLEKCFCLDPSKRITVEDALFNHPFLKDA